MVVPDNRQGYKDGDVIATGVEGYQVSVYKEKSALSGGNLLSKETVSTNDYKKRDEIIARIGALDPDVPQTEPTDSDTPGL
jgi:hypothetical protein